MKYHPLKREQIDFYFSAQNLKSTYKYLTKKKKEKKTLLHDKVLTCDKLFWENYILKTKYKYV